MKDVTYHDVVTHEDITKICNAVWAQSREINALGAHRVIGHLREMEENRENQSFILGARSA